jgi:putative membrane protein
MAIPDVVRRLERPHPRLMTLYLLSALLGSLATCGLALPVALVGLIPLWIRYHTLRYRFDEEGVGVSWGYFFRHESHITYDKIQDIHVDRGLLERWLGLGTVEVQTAAGSAGAEISLPGLVDYDPVRDYLYARMRGAHDEGAEPAPAAAEGEAEALALLRGIRDEVARLGERLGGAAPRGRLVAPPPRVEEAPGA